MKQDETNAKVLAQLQEYAQLYFEAVIETNTKDGKCDLRPGKYSANELTDNSYKSVLGHAWLHPSDSMFNEELTIEAGAFQCSFPYRRIFEILAKWEAMMGARKQKAVFEIGEVEEKSAKVILSETTESGSYKEKRVRAQRIVGNWWAPRKSKKSDIIIYLYYELNGVMFIPGRYVLSDDELHSDRTKEWCERFDDVKITELLLAQVSTEGRKPGYWSEIANLAGVLVEKQDTEESAEAPAAMENMPEQPEMSVNGSIRAKVLQYKSDGNTLTEKWETLKKFADGIYYTEETACYGNATTCRLIFEKNGVYWYSGNARSKDLENPENRAKVVEIRAGFEQNVGELAENGRYIRLLEIEVMRRLGYDVAPLIASREAYLKHREEEERQKAEDAARREQQRKEAEERRKAELLAEGKEKLLNHKTITEVQIELIAEAVGYTIHGRTLGFMREKVSEVILREDETVTVWGRKLTNRNINGTADVVRELADRVKAQAETETQQPAAPTGTPIKQHYYISDNFGTFEAVDGRILVGRNEEFTKTCENGIHGYLSGVPLFEVNKQTALFLQCRKHGDDEKGIAFIITKIAEYAEAVRILDELAKTDNSILPTPQNCRDAVNAYISLTATETPQISTEAAEAVECAAKGETTQGAAYITAGENKAPQSPQIAPAASHATPAPKRRQRPRIQPKTAIWRHRHHMRGNNARTTAHRSTFLAPPGICSTANSPPRPTYQPTTIHSNNTQITLK